MAKVQDVAAAIIDRKRPIDQMQLNKLLYLAQGWSQAWRGQPLFDDPIEAWKYGPVVDAVYQDYKSNGASKFADAVRGDPANLTPEETSLLATVLRRYDGLSGPALSRRTHEDDAWREAWERRSSVDRGRQVIRPSAIADSVLEAGLEPSTARVPIDAELAQRIAAGDGEALATLFGVQG